MRPADAHGGGGDDGLPPGRRGPAIAAVLLGVVLAVLDGAIANVALPTFSHVFRASPGAAVWVVNGYQLAVVSLLLPAASLGERLGYRRVYLAALALFTASSIGCACAGSLGALIAWRALQGAGGAGLMSLNGALFRLVVPTARFGRAMAMTALTVSLSAAAGPSAAAAILAVAPWPFLFAVNVPLGLASLAVGSITLPSSERGERRFDAASAALNALAFGLGFVGLEAVARGHGGGRAFGAVELAIGLAAAALLFRRERAQFRPMLPVDLLRIPLFAGSIATSIASFTTQGLAYVALPFLFVDTLDRGTVAAGLLLTPWPLAIAAVSPVAGRLADRFSAGLLGGIGLAVLAIGCFALATVGPHTPVARLVAFTALAGAGFGLFQSPNNRALMLSAPRPRAGAANGALATARLTGQTLGASAAAVLLGFGSRAPLRCLAVAGVVACVAALLSLMRLGLAATAPDIAASTRRS